MFLIDLDDFALINEKSGAAVSDALLQSAADAIEGVFRSGDLIGRVGGDRFLVFLAGTLTGDLVSGKAQAVLDALQFPVGEATLTVSVGAVLRRAPQTYEQLYAAADQALEQAKSAGKHGYVFSDFSGACRQGSITGTAQSAAVQYQALLSCMRGGVLLADVTADDIRITYASSSVYRMAEKNREAMSEHEKNALDMVYPPDLPLLLDTIHRAAESGAVTDLTYRIGPDGLGWHHIRITRLQLMAGGTASIIGVLSDMTDYKRSEEALRQSEERYRIADELSHALIWEVDIATHTLYQSAETSRALGHSGSVYHNMPDGLLATGTVHPSSVEEFRRMYADIYAGITGREYMLLNSDGGHGYVWLRTAFRLLRDKNGTPVRAIGIAEKLPGIGQEMQGFEDELYFSDAAVSSTLGIFRANLTRDSLERSMPPLPVNLSSFGELRDACARDIHPDDRSGYLAVTEREALLRSYDEGRLWMFTDYRMRSPSGDWCWVNLAINLLRQPVSGDIFIFGYLRNVDIRHRWAEAMDCPPERERTTMLYTRDSLSALSTIAAAQMPEGQKCALTVFELTDYERIKSQRGAQAAQRILSQLGHLCRIMIDGSVVIGHPGEALFAVFRTNAVSAERQQSEIIRYRNRVRFLMKQALSDLNGDIACGFVLSEKQEFQFDRLLRNASVACRISQEQPGSPVTEYSDPGNSLYAEEQPSAPQNEARKCILVADDEFISRQLLRMILEQEYEVDEAEDGEQVLEMLRQKQYALLLCDIQMPRKTGWDVLEGMQAEKKLLKTPVVIITADDGQDSEVKALNLGASDVIVKPIVPEVLVSRARNIIGRQEAAAAMERNALYEMRFQQQANLLRQAEYDELTGLYNRQGFFRHVRERLDAAPHAAFRLIRWDLDNFKMVNDSMGVESGDQLLRDAGAALQDIGCADAVLARLEADHFVVFLSAEDLSPQELLSRISDWFQTYPFRFKLSAHMGVYTVEDPSVEVCIMCDRALLALKSVKDSFTQRIGLYDESLRQSILEEQELSGEMVSALEDGQFVLYFQPQINYDSGAMIGAEALVRWKHPTRGLIPPGKFIPLFERNGFITTLDEYIWEQSCRCMRRWLDQKGKLLPISVSVNISRVDISNPCLREHLQGLVRRYDLPASYLRLEITESAYMQNPDQLIAVVRDLRSAGFTVEMDDFGAGYSSLNTLKDVPVNVLKLDTRFLSGGEDDARGGSILSSIIRMAHWLDMPVIAEGVETRSQADYLKSLNCFYMQDYLFGKPMPEDEFEKILEECFIGSTNRFGSTELQGVSAFWDPSAQTTLLFNSLVDGAAILEYRGGLAEILRANDKYYTQLGTTREQYLEHQKHILDRFDPQSRTIYVAMLEEAIRTGEAECELQSLPLDRAGRPYWTHNRVRLLATNADGFLFYLAVENVTDRKEMEEQLRLSQDELQLAVSRMGKALFRYDIPSRTLTLPESYAETHRLPCVLADFPDGVDLHSLLPWDTEQFYAFFRDIVSGKPDCRISARIRMKDGSFRWEHYEATLVADRKGRPARAVITAEDITAQVEQSVDNERNRLLLERPGTCLFDYDTRNDLLIYQVNIPGGDIRKRTISSFRTHLQHTKRVPPETLSLLERAMSGAVLAPSQRTMEFRADLWDTGIRWCRLRYASIADDSGKVYRCLGQGEDIHEEQMAAELNRQILRQLGENVFTVHDSVLPECVLNLLYGTEDLNGAIQKILETACLYYDADRAFIYEELPDGSGCRPTFCWHVGEPAWSPASLPELRYGDAGGRDAFTGRFDADGISLCGTDGSPGAIPGLPEDICTLLRFSMLDRGRFRGFVGFADCAPDRSWSDRQRATLGIVSRLVGTFLLKWRDCPPAAESHS